MNRQNISNIICGNLFLTFIKRIIFFSYFKILFSFFFFKFLINNHEKSKNISEKKILLQIHPKYI